MCACSASRNNSLINAFIAMFHRNSSGCHICNKHRNRKRGTFSRAFFQHCDVIFFKRIKPAGSGTNNNADSIRINTGFINFCIRDSFVCCNHSELSKSIHSFSFFGAKNSIRIKIFSFNFCCNSNSVTFKRHIFNMRYPAFAVNH